MSCKSLLVLALVAATAGGLLFHRLFLQESVPDLLKAARAALDASQFDEAERLAGRVLAKRPEHVEALFVAGMAAAEAGRSAQAVAYFDRIADEDPRAAEARFRAGDILLLQLYQLAPAEQRLRAALRLEPGHPAAQQRLAGLLGLCGRSWEASGLRLERIRRGNILETDLVLLALGDTAAENADLLAEFVQASPDDPLTRLARAHRARQQHDLELAEDLLRKVIADRPDLVAAHAKLGGILIDRGDADALAAWHAGLPAAADEFPDIWAVRGDWCRQRGDLAGAVRCYGEALRIDPTHQRSNFQVSQVLVQQGESADAGRYAARAAALQDVLIAAKGHLGRKSPHSVRQSIAACRRAGLAWEAWGWAQILASVAPDAAAAVPRPASDTPRLAAAGKADTLRPLLDQPLPEWVRAGRSAAIDRPRDESAAGAAAQIAFVDDALSAGLEFRYMHGEPSGERGLRIFQFSGGGVAVLDYDQDGWPDLYFPQGHPWPPSAGPHPMDRLFRNLGNGRFEDVTEAARLPGDGYGQGVTVGDFDNDGFPDLYVATLAGNRLYRNNGDGTYTDVTDESGTAGDGWTTSCLMADLNGDGLPDIYAVNYLQSDDLHERICRNHDGRLRACSPHEFDAAQDQLWLNLGDGRFREATREAGIVAPGGKGLGVVAADFDGSGRLGLFVANDTTANFFFVNQTPSPGGPPRFQESALAAGLAYDRDGRSQACMGIAAGDADGDGLLDLFVTNYYDESNTFYHQQDGGFFVDATGAAGLRGPGLKLLGFGTQFLDADLDGRPDLVVVNGHVDDETYRGIPYRMPPQFFRNMGGGRFTEISTQAGPWFSQPQLGRAAARLDWNRDGLEDFVVTHLDTPAALLTNRTRSPGRSVRIRLRGVESARDAIGATVHVQAQGRTMSRQLTAGDGYQSSNQRQLVFGLGEAGRVESVEVRWPAGRVQQFGRLEAGREYVFVEGRAEPLALAP